LQSPKRIPLANDLKKAFPKEEREEIWADLVLTRNEQEAFQRFLLLQLCSLLGKKRLFLGLPLLRDG
jgi:hypothetical protein